MKSSSFLYYLFPLSNRCFRFRRIVWFVLRVRLSSFSIVSPTQVQAIDVYRFSLLFFVVFSGVIDYYENKIIVSEGWFTVSGICQFGVNMFPFFLEVQHVPLET